MLPEEKMMVDRMLAEGKISTEDADSLIKVLEGKDDHSEGKRTQSEEEIVQSESSLQSLGNTIKKFFQNGDIYNKGYKYKVIRNLSGEFAREKTT